MKLYGELSAARCDRRSIRSQASAERPGRSHFAGFPLDATGRVTFSVPEPVEVCATGGRSVALRVCRLSSSELPGLPMFPSLRRTSPVGRGLLCLLVAVLVMFAFQSV